MDTERAGLLMGGFIKGILSDNGHVKRNTIVQIVIATIAFILLVRIYPFAVVENHTISKQQAFDKSGLSLLSGDKFDSLDKKLQMVYFTNDHLYRIKLYMAVDMPSHVSDSQSVTFRVYDDGFSCISSEKISLFKVEKAGYLTATPDIDVEQGRAYYYEVLVPEGCEAYIELPVSSKESLGQPENSVLYIDGIYNDELSLVADYDYSKPLTGVDIILRYIVIIALAWLLYVAVIYCLSIYDDKFSEYNGRLLVVFKVIVSIMLVLIGLGIIVYSVVLNSFGSPVLDRIIYFIAVVAGVLWCFGGLWLTKYYPKAKRDYTSPLIWKNYIQTLSFGLLFYALCQYVNADREFYHMTNTRWMLIFLAIAFLMLLGGKVIVNRVSLVWLVFGWMCSAVYCHGFKGDENNYLLARLTCGVIVAWGLFIINLIISYRRQGVKYRLSLVSIRSYCMRNRFQTVFVGLWILFALLMYTYRFEKVWVFTATLPFCSLLFVKITPQVGSRFLKNFTNGVILSFLLVTLFCLHHRPHYYWMLYRYGGIFHTVACTGMYLSVVFAALVGKLYGRLKDRKSMFLRCYCEFLLLGCVTGYIILTMSRTAFMTVAVCTVLTIILAAVTYKKRFKRIAQEVGILLATIVVCFPIVFSAVRMVPALINDPVIYDLEYHDEEWIVDVGEPIYSEDYMTVERFFNVLLGRFSTTQEGDDEESKGALLAYAGEDIANMVTVSEVATLQEGADDEETDISSDIQEDISNGRFKIFSEYIKAIRFSGHPATTLVSEEGEEYAHAHNSYLQVFYNFGIIAGVIFLILCVMSLWKSTQLVIKNGRKYSIYFVPFALIVAFGFISLTEWAFHPCIPAGFCFLLMQAVIIKG